MLFSLWPARITARISESPASFSKPSRMPLVDGGGENVERAGVADRQANDASCVAVDAAMGIEHFHLVFSGLLRRLVSLPGDCAGLSRVGRRLALRGGHHAYRSMIIIQKEMS